jgi:DNA-binding transcriptional LysR family regulator
MFVVVVRAGSVNGAGRALRLSPSQVSKALSRLERTLGRRLVARSTRGVELSDDGRRLAPRFIELLDHVRRLESPSDHPEFVIAAPSFFWTAVLPSLRPLLRRVRIYSIEIRSSAMPALAGRPLFDAAFCVGEQRWPSSWVQVQAGFVRRALFATPNKARELGLSMTRESLRKEHFVGRLEDDWAQLVPAPDGCPLSDRDRTFGHRTQTASLALEIARLSDQLVFAPLLAAGPYLRRRSLVEIRVPGLQVREPLYVACQQDRVGSSIQRALVSAARAALANE